MAKNPDKVTSMMEELGCTGKRVTKELIESRIESVDYQTVVIAGQKMMFCGIRMLGGFVAIGKPAVCIDPSNWRDEIGQQISYDNAFEELWKLEAYHMTYQAPAKQPLHSFDGFSLFDDGGKLKHICKLRDTDVLETSTDFASMASKLLLRVKGSSYAVTSDAPFEGSDFLVIMDDDPSDIYIAKAAALAGKQTTKIY